METDGLVEFHIIQDGFTQFYHPATIGSISMLSNGTLVANVADSGIQLLDLENMSAEPESPSMPAITVDAFDGGKIIATVSANRDYVVILDSQLIMRRHIIPAQNSRKIPSDRPPALCASLENGTVVQLFEEGGEEHLQLWRFGRESPEWTVAVDQMPSVGGISPSGARLVTFQTNRLVHCISVWNARNGQLQAHMPIPQSLPTPPLDVKFESEDRFYSEHDGYRIPYTVTLSMSGVPSHSLVRHEQLPFVGRPSMLYDVDDTREWVVGSAGRICWIPPGYIRPGDRSYCWVGNTLYMVGQDGACKMLSFWDPPEIRLL
jgi:hypothetical protein